MYKSLRLLLFSWLLGSLLPLQSSLADVGTAAYYGPPHLPTVCFGGYAGQFPANNLFAAAGDGIWDAGASCGRKYLVRCLSSAKRGLCIKDQTVEVMVVDRGTVLHSVPSMNGTTMVLSAAAFQMIANQTANVVNIEFTQV